MWNLNFFIAIETRLPFITKIYTNTDIITTRMLQHPEFIYKIFAHLNIDMSTNKISSIQFNDIKFQNTRFSIIQVSFRATSHEIKHGRQIANLDDGILEPINTIVLDKRVTQSVRAFSITSYVRVIPRNLQIDLPVGSARINGRFRPNFLSINLVNLGNTESEFAKEFSLKKIDL